jgi:DNA invertase Pin-like site-specific DNA recombinase
MAAPEMKTTLKVIEMLRVSSDKQDVARQEFDVAENRDEHNLNVLRTIRLKISGTLVMTHPDVQQMIAEIAQAGVDGVSISAIDRLFRPKDYESLKMFDFFARNGKLIVSTKEGVVDPASDKGWDICIGGAAQRAGAELRELKRRTNGGRKKSHAKGLMCNGSACYGMVYVSRYERDAQGKAQYLKEDSVESSITGLSKRQVVTDVFNWRYFHKVRTYAIVKRLNAAGIRSAKGGLWSRQTVIQMLKNSSYTGQHHEGDSVFPCPKFVEMEVFQGVQEMFAEAKRHHNGRPTRQSFFRASILRARGAASA